MNQSRYQQLLQRRFGDTRSPMKTVSWKALDAQVGADDANRELQLGQLALRKKEQDRNVQFGRERLSLANKDYRNERDNMRTANWLNAGGVALGLGQGMLERKRYNTMADMYRQQMKMMAPPNYNYGYGLGGAKYGIGGE